MFFFPHNFHCERKARKIFLLLRLNENLKTFLCQGIVQEGKKEEDETAARRKSA
jgi:hypothetical protein